MSKELVLLFSGGADSVLLLIWALKLGYRVTPLMIDYGQEHREELEFAKKFLSERGINGVTIKIPLSEITVAKLLGTAVQYEGVSEWHVPSRNLIFLSLAASLAETCGVPLIWYGADYSDREHLFPDCYQEWVMVANNLLQINGSMKIRLEAPLLGFTKETVLEMLKLEGVTLENLFSGYGNAK